MGKDNGRVLMGLFAPLLYFFLFLILPISFLVAKFSVADVFYVAHEYKKLISYNISQALLSATLATSIGALISYYLARKNIKGILRNLIHVMAKISFVVPGVSMAIGFYLLFGRKGFINDILGLFGLHIDILYTFLAVILGHAFYNIPVSVYIVGSVWERFDGNLIEASYVDGCRDFQTFLKVELPILTPSIVASFLLSFIYSFTSFAVVLIIGGPKYSTLEVVIYMYLKNLLNFKVALSLTFLQLFIIATAAAISSYLLKGKIPFGVPKLKKVTFFDYIALSMLLSLVFLPLILSIVSGFLTKNPSKSVFDIIKIGMSFLGVSFWKMLLTSLLISIATAFISITIGLITGRMTSKGYKALQIFPFLPTAFSTVTLAFGYLMISLKFNIPSVYLLPFLHSLLSIPLVHGIIEMGWRNVERSIEEAAMMDGASFWDMLFKIYLPLLKNFLIRAFTFSMAISLSDLSGVLILSNESVFTFSKAIYRLMSSRHMPEARILNTIFLLMVMLIYYFGEMKTQND
ncbi:MAG: iron ABC transporter permease [Thermotogaceae bacterium]|nr:iron ABC transporter permease [Thermotogaceae bacterium]